VAKPKKKRAKARRSASSEVTVRFANEGRPMAKKRKSGGRKKARKNPSNPPRRRASGRRTKSNPPRRRRRNPRGGGFGDRAVKLAGGAAIALIAGAGVLVGMSKLAPTYPNVAEYGVPLAGFALGAALYKSHPTIGAGLALGSVAAPFALPLGSKILNATNPAPASTTTTAAGIAAVMRQMGAVQRPMGAVQMGRAYRGYT
jgi:hypothetical protein